MITKLSVRNYKSLREVQVDLQRFTVFVGPNASGKSSILQALHALCLLFDDDLVQQTPGELRRSLSRGASEPIELVTEVGSKAYRYRVSPISPIGRRPRGVKLPWSGNGRAFATTTHTADWALWENGNPSPLPPSVLLRLEASKLVPPTPSADPTVMAPDGTGLHSALASMALNDPDSWQQLQTDLRRIIPTIRRLRHTLTKPNQPPSLLFDTLGADSVSADQVSEGTLLVLGLLAALHAPNRPSLILLDDLDRGLHPKAQKELVALLRGLMDANPDLQIVATTHSPYMLDCVDVSEVRMTFLKDDGSTACAALTDHPKFPKWKDEMTPGEMWSLFGEKWVVEGATA